MINVVELALAGLTTAGVVQASAGWIAVERFQRRLPNAPGARPAVTILKPLHGDEPLLEAALASFCAQDYPMFQIVFGVQDRADPALAVLARLRQQFPTVDMAVVVDPTSHGSNHKISNMLNGFPVAKHDVLVIADSDIHAAPDYLDKLVQALEQPGVGLVTTLYAGLSATDTLIGKLGAAQINHAFLPGALLARSLGRQDCLGATMCLTRATLEQVGGLHALVNHLADDAVLGQLVRHQGGSIALADTVPATTVPEVCMPALFRHELRWGRTIRSLAPVGLALSAVQYPLFWVALLLGVSGGSGWAWLLFTAVWGVRAATAARLNRALKVASPLPIWCLPFRDLFSMTVMLASYWSDRVSWRGQWHRVSRPRLVAGKG